MDQCTYCVARGDMKKCLSTECSIHETWFVKTISAKLPSAYEIWAVAQLMPGEGIEDGVRRIKELLATTEAGEE